MLLLSFFHRKNITKIYKAVSHLNYLLQIIMLRMLNMVLFKWEMIQYTWCFLNGKLYTTHGT